MITSVTFFSLVRMGLRFNKDMKGGPWAGLWAGGGKEGFEIKA